MIRLEVNNSFCRIVGKISTDHLEFVSECISYSNDVRYELKDAFFLLQRLRRWGKSDREIGKQLEKIEVLKASEHVFLLEGRKFPTGLLNIVRAALKRLNLEFFEEDLRIIPKPSLILPWRNKPFDLRPYQEEAVGSTKTSPRGILSMATGVGKTLCAAYIIKEKKVPTLIVTPSSGISTQIYGEFKIWFGDSKVGLITTNHVRDKKELPALRIMTIQSIASLIKTGDVEHLVEGVDQIFMDEFHHSASKSYLNLQGYLEKIYYKYGLTATPTRGDRKILSLYGVLSNKIFEYPAKQAIAEGFLTPMTIQVHKVQGVINGNYKREYDLNYGGESILDAVVRICEEIDLNKEQVLVLVKLKSKVGTKILDRLSQEGFNPTFVSGDDPKEDLTQTTEDFNVGKIRILIGSAVVGEGIDIRATHHFLMCQGGKSPINVIQGAGRLVRLHPGKKVGVYHDFKFAGTKFLTRHLKIRVKNLIENFDPEDVVEISHL